MGDQKTLSRSAIRRQREREERYQTILRAAETLFYKEGYHQTSIHKISDLGEISIGTVYFYFKNKEDLLIHLLNETSFLFRSRIGNEFKKMIMIGNWFFEVKSFFKSRFGFENGN